MFEKVSVLDSLEPDHQKEIVRLDPDLFKKLDLKVGEILELTNLKTKNKISGIVSAPLKDDKGKNGIRLNPRVRVNFRVNAGDFVKIRKINHNLAYLIKFVGINGAEIYGCNSIELHNSSKLISRLNGIIVNKDQIIDVDWFGKSIKLKAIYCSPDLECVIHHNTRIQIIKLEFDDPEVQNRLKNIMKMSSHIKLDMLKNILDMEIEHFVDSIVKWQEEMDFKIKDGNLFFDLGGTEETFDALDEKISEWFRLAEQSEGEEVIDPIKAAGLVKFYQKLLNNEYRSIVESLAELGDKDAMQSLRILKYSVI